MLFWLLGACAGEDETEETPVATEGGEEVRPAIRCTEDTVFVGDRDEVYEEQYCQRESVLHGPYVRFWLSTGKQATSGYYADNQPVDNWVEWHENGKKSASGKYEKGKKRGPWTTWYPNGNRMEEGDYLADRRAGQWSTWYESGLKKEEGMYHNNQKDGVWTFYKDEEGNPVDHTESWKHGQLVK